MSSSQRRRKSARAVVYGAGLGMVVGALLEAPGEGLVFGAAGGLVLALALARMRRS